MMTLRNFRKVELPRSADKRRRFSLDCYIGAVQMFEVGDGWYDIAPRLVPQGDNLVAEGTPYALEVKPNGTRIIWPDKHDRSVYMKLPAPTALSGLTASADTSRVVYQSSQREAAFRLTNTGVKFDMLLKEAPSFDRVTFDVDAAGLDIAALLKAKTGLGIPQPQVEEVESTTLRSRLARTIQTFTPGLSVRELLTRPVEWKYSNGQLELGFDLTGMRFPVRLRNTTLDLQVEANADDGTWWAGNETFYSNDNTFYAAGYYDATFTYGNSFARFTGLAGAAGATIDVAYYTLICQDTRSANTVNAIISAIAADNAAAPTSYNEAENAVRTTANTLWNAIPAWTVNLPYNSPSLVSVFQEMSDNGHLVSGVAVVYSEDNGSTVAVNTFRRGYAHDLDPTKAPALYLEYSVAAGGGFGAIV